MQKNPTSDHHTLTDKQRYWLDHVERCESLGQTMVAYAQTQSLRLKQFYNWKTRLIRLGVLPTSSTHVAFKQVAVKAPTGLNAGCRIDFPNGLCLTVEPGCDPGWLKDIIHVLGERR